jgi:tRNA nucleotidyltransferase (CCA-adding enzyme)
MFTISRPMPKNTNLISRLHGQLPAAPERLLDSLLLLCEQRGVAAYLVGGPLRDLLLDRPFLDLDIAVEGDAIALARDLADSLSIKRDVSSARPEVLVGRAGHPRPEFRVITHPRFGTATVRLEGFHLDLIAARSETYSRPGALPTVKPATIRQDLLRRDFTINALALRLNGPDAGEVLDPSGGRSDLDARLIRVLHERSFQDDATRIIRAFRYAARLGFDIEPQTLEWLKRDLRYLDTISSTRLHRELARILAEPAPEDVLTKLHRAGALAAMHPALRFERRHAQAFARIRELHPAGARAAYWPLLAWRLGFADTALIVRRLALTQAQRAALEAMPALERIVSRRDASARRLGAEGVRTTPLKRSGLAEILSPFPLPALWAFAALTDDPTIHDRLLDYLTKARNERPLLTADDLIALGVPPSKLLGDILERLRMAKLDGEVVTREDEERLVRRLLGSQQATTAN